MPARVPSGAARLGPAAVCAMRAAAMQPQGRSVSRASRCLHATNLACAPNLAPGSPGPGVHQHRPEGRGGHGEGLGEGHQLQGRCQSASSGSAISVTRHLWRPGLALEIEEQELRPAPSYSSWHLGTDYAIHGQKAGSTRRSLHKDVNMGVMYAPLQSLSHVRLCPAPGPVPCRPSRTWQCSLRTTRRAGIVRWTPSAASGERCSRHARRVGTCSCRRRP